jgi:aspartate/methionine/tyrosine aminotransferase
MRKLADGRLCSPGPMQYAVTAALTGDRSHQVSFRQALAERARITTESLNAIPGMRCVSPRAAFYAMPAVSLPPGRTDEDYVLALLRETGILCVYGSGFGVAPERGTFRIVFLANPKELESIYADIGAFTGEYLHRAGR